MPAAELKITADNTIRVYADISVEAEAKLRMRTAQHQRDLGRRVTRREYLEHLIEQDIAHVNGASVRTISQRASNQRKG